MVPPASASLAPVQHESQAIDPREYWPPDLIAQPPCLRVGDTLGKYDLLELLGEGTMSQVFLARHALLERRVALKVLRPELSRQYEAVRRFFQEARAVNQINHENIAQIFDFVQELDRVGDIARVYCVMEVVGGWSLARWFQSGDLRLNEVVSALKQVCVALSAAHRVGVVHRDIKPDNILIERRQGAVLAKVVDFGVAKLCDGDGQSSAITSAGRIIGTPLYMAPEQASGIAVDYRVDIYAVGAVLYEALAGRPPFHGDSFGALLTQVVTAPVPPLPGVTLRGEEIPASLSRLVEACLRKDPGARPPSMLALVRVLEEQQQLQAYATTVTAEARRTGEHQGGRRLPALAASVAAVCAGLALMLHLSSAPSSPHHQVRGALDLAKVSGPAQTTAPLGQSDPLVWPARAFSALAALPLGPLAALPPTVVAPSPAPLGPPAPAPAAAAAAVVRPAEALPPPTRTRARNHTSVHLVDATTTSPSGMGEVAAVSLRDGKPFYAAVSVDGLPLGNSPLERSLPAGSHRLRFERAGFGVVERTIEVTQGKVTRVQVVLAP